MHTHRPKRTFPAAESLQHGPWDRGWHQQKAIPPPAMSAIAEPSTGHSTGPAAPPANTEERLVADLIALMETGGTPWRRPWREEGGQHVNLISGRPYRGANPVLLSLGLALRDSDLPYWCGWGEARRLGLAPRRGSRGVMILRPLPRPPRPSDRGDGEAEPSPPADRPRTGAIRCRPMVVFNAADLVGDPQAGRALADAIQRCRRAARCDRPEPETRLRRAEAVLAAWPVSMREGGDQACYSPSLDRIVLPEAGRFSSSAARLATWAHEAIHSTGHPNRLGRDLAAPFGSDPYAREELLAELGAVLVGERLAIGSDTANHAAYLQHWCALLRRSPRLLLQLLGEARRAADLIVPEGPAEDPAGSASRSEAGP